VHLTAFSKGKVERAGIGYLSQNFWPLRAFSDLAHVDRQVRQWLDEVANQRTHRETRESPDQRFLASTLLPLPNCYPATETALKLSSARISVWSSMATATALQLAMPVAV